MTKADLVKEVAKSSGLTQTDAEVVVETVLESIKEALNSGDEVELRSFGSFRLRKKTPDGLAIQRLVRQSRCQPRESLILS